MTFTTAATVNVRHVDILTGKDIVPDQSLTYGQSGQVVGGTYTTETAKINNYVYLGLNNLTDSYTVKGKTVKLPKPIVAKGITEISLPKEGSLAKEGNNGTVIYLYAPNPEGTFDNANVTGDKSTEKIHYQELNTNKTLAPDNIATVNFVTGSKGNKSITLYNNNEDSTTDVKSWHNVSDNNAHFINVDNPEITGYHIVEIAAANEKNPSDLTEVEQKYAKAGIDQDYIVYYVKDQSTSEGGNEGNNNNGGNNGGNITTPVDPDGTTDTETPDTSEEPDNPDETIDTETPEETADNTDTDTDTDTNNGEEPNGSTDTDNKDHSEDSNDDKDSVKVQNSRDPKDSTVTTNDNSVTEKVNYQTNNKVNTQNNDLTTAAKTILGNKTSLLPQTGNKKSSWLSYLGLALMSFLPIIFKKH